MKNCFPKIQFLIAALSVIAASTGSTAEYGSYADALARAAESRRPLLVEYSADWCHFCTQMEKETLSQAEVRDAMTPFEFVTVDFDREPDLARRHGVSGIPAFVILSDEGDLIDSTAGFQPPTPFREWLMQGQTLAAHFEARKLVFHRQCEQIQTELKTGRPQSRRNATAQLLQMAAEKEAGRQAFAKAELAGLMREDAPLVAEGMRHPMLATRLVVANLFRDQLDVVFDPWAPIDERDRQVKQWLQNQAGPVAEPGP